MLTLHKFGKGEVTHLSCNLHAREPWIEIQDLIIHTSKESLIALRNAISDNIKEVESKVTKLQL